jgi:hypothetical protein
VLIPLTHGLSDGNNPKTSRVLFTIIFSFIRRRRKHVGECGEPPFQNEPPSICFTKIRKILIPSKSFEEKFENNSE